MLKKIKTSFFLKALFYHISEHRKLKIAKYSKYLQKDLDRKIIHYKSFSGRYIIFSKDEKGKEFDGYSDTLIFEGEYLNGERNGKGKEYYGEEYLNCLKNGKGKEINPEGIIMFGGEYLNNLINGKGKNILLII